jgi:hypothetical protein
VTKRERESRLCALSEKGPTIEINAGLLWATFRDPTSPIWATHRAVTVQLSLIRLKVTAGIVHMEIMIRSFMILSCKHPTTYNCLRLSTERHSQIRWVLWISSLKHDHGNSSPRFQDASLHRVLSAKVRTGLKVLRADEQRATVRISAAKT